MKILITGPDFHRIKNMIEKAFYELGCEVKISSSKKRKSFLPAR